jgi:hypothetical protein
VSGDNPQERLNKMNQKWLEKIPPKIGFYLAGFADGEGSFNVPLRKRSDHTIGWQVVLNFNVSQRESYILSQFKKHLGCGRLQERIDGVWYYTVSNPLAIREKVIPFFEKFYFLSQRKKQNFSIFKKIVTLVFAKKHLDPAGLKEIIRLREQLNKGAGRKRKYHIHNVTI